MGEKLTPKQEAFALAYVETGNASEAYRRAYDAENMSADAIHVKASELLKNGKVTVRVIELQAQARQRAEVSIDDVVSWLKREATGIDPEGGYLADSTSAARVSACDKLLRQLGGYEKDNSQRLPVIPQQIALVAPKDADASD